MCSATSSDPGRDGPEHGGDAGTGTSARRRLIEAAIELIGSEGVRAATVRRVAETADVSPALVLHHFGSKDGLVAQCDQAVLDLLREAMDHMAAEGPDGGTQQLLTMDGAGPAIAYVGRSVLDGGPAGRHWFRTMYDLSIDSLAEFQDRGLARPTDDPQMVALLMVAMDLGMIVLRPLIENLVGTSVTDPDFVRRWILAELDVMTHGVLVARPDDDAIDHPAPGGTTTT